MLRAKCSCSSTTLQELLLAAAVFTGKAKRPCLASAVRLHRCSICAANPDAPEAEWEGKDLVALHFALAPVTRITSRIIFTVTSSFLPTTGLKAALIKVLNRTWRDHITRSTVLDGDAIFLHRQTIDLVNGMLDAHSAHARQDALNTSAQCGWLTVVTSALFGCFFGA